MTYADVYVIGQARRAYAQLPPAQRQQTDNVLDALAIAPDAGAFYRKNGAGRTLRIISAADVHLVYRIVFQRQGDAVYVLELIIAAWNPQDMP